MKLSMRVPRSFLHSNVSDPPKSANGGENETIIPVSNSQSVANPPSGKPQQSIWAALCCCCPTSCRCYPVVRWYIWHKDEQLRSFCWITAWLHFLAMFAYSGLKIAQDLDQITIPRLKTPITKSIGIWTMPNDMAIINATPLSTRLQLDQCPLASAVDAKDSKYVVQQLVLDAEGEIDTRALIIAFHAFSFVFQAFTAYGDKYYQELKRGRTNLSHFIEYSLTASLLLIAMATQFGTTDIFLLISIGANCTGCMLFGLMAEFLFPEDLEMSFSAKVVHPKEDNPPNKDDEEAFKGGSLKAHWIAHFAGWFMLSVALITVCSNLITIQTCTVSSDARPPSFVQWIVGSEIFLFSCFGFVQMISFLNRENVLSNESEERSRQMEQNKNVAQRTEFCYILLSIVAKLSLGIIVMAGNYTNTKK